MILTSQTLNSNSALKEILQRNDYPKSFIDNCFKKFLDRLHIIEMRHSKLMPGIYRNITAKMKLSKESLIRDHVLQYDNNP